MTATTETPQRTRAVLQSFADGKTARQIADALGIASLTVLTIARDNGVVVDGAGRARPTPALAAAAAAANGHTPAPAGDLAGLIERGVHHPTKRIRAKARRLRDLAGELEQLLNAEAERDLIRNEVAKATAALAAAKAKLRAAGGSSAPRSRAGTGDHPCPTCGVTFPTPRGVRMHTLRVHRDGESS